MIDKELPLISKVRHEDTLFIYRLFRYPAPMTTVISYAEAQHRKLLHAAGFFSSGRFTEAEALFAELADEKSIRPDVLSRFGHLALLSNRIDDAIEYLAATLRFNSRSVSAWDLLAEAYYRKGELGPAAYCYNRIKRHGLAATLAAMGDIPRKGHGGGGEVRGRPVRLDRLSLGTA